MEVQGFRSQRTIAQFQLESVPQIFLQLRMYYILQNLESENLKVSGKVILASVFCALVHIVFEMTSLYVEATTTETSFLEYMIACYNSREGWIPRRRSIESLRVETVIAVD